MVLFAVDCAGFVLVAALLNIFLGLGRTSELVRLSTYVNVLGVQAGPMTLVSG